MYYRNSEVSILRTLQESEACLLAAIELAREGNIEPARAVAVVEVQRFPEELGVLHKAGVIMRFCKESETALLLFKRALVAHPCFHYTEIEIADVYFERGDKEQALHWYRRAIESAPDYPIGYLRAARLEREFGRSFEGLLLLEELHRRIPNHVETNVLRADFLQYHGDRPSAVRAYAAAIAAGCDDPMAHFHYMRLLTETALYSEVLAHLVRLKPANGSFLAFHAAVFSGHAKLALATDQAHLIASAMARERSVAWLNSDALLKRLQGAIYDRTPLSLIRLGDGEARFLAWFHPWVRGIVSSQEANCIVSVIWQNWFGTIFDTTSPNELAHLAEMFVDALRSADILGISTAERYQSDAFHRGYLGLLERVLGEVCAAGASTTDALANIELHRQSRFYAALLVGLDFIGVISPHPGLAARLARYHGIAGFHEYIVPGESRLPEVVWSANRGQHFPNVFRETLAALRVPRSGAVFLVAAGLLGKVYCHRIRQLGGIAIDVGSVVDAWMGYNTRPGQYDNLQEWQIPQ